MIPPPRALAPAFLSNLLNLDIMKPEIHPAYDTIKVVCACGNSFETRSTLGEELQVEICSACHPFYTGQQKIVDTAGRVGKFQKKYGRSA